MWLVPELKNVEFSLESVRIATPTLQHLGRIRLRGYTDQNAFLNSPRLIGTLRTQVALQLPVHNRSGNEQREFSQARQLVLFSKTR